MKKLEMFACSRRKHKFAHGKDTRISPAAFVLNRFSLGFCQTDLGGLFPMKNIISF